MTKPLNLILAAACLSILAATACAKSNNTDCTKQGWLSKSDSAFAEDCVAMAFDGSLEDREKLAWMFFTRVNQLIADPTNKGMSGTGKVPVWMAWPTDPDTFGSAKVFVFNNVPRSELKPSAEKKDILAGRTNIADPDGANEEVTRNQISYDYLTKSGLTTQIDIASFFANNDYVNMPVGSIELKASWLQVTPGSPAPDGALTFQFENSKYWWRGIHIMVKMQSLANPSSTFYSEEPSWFWTTFEFNNNDGVGHVRDKLITQRAPLSVEQISSILSVGNLDNFGLDAYSPNGTQIGFTVNGTGETPVILGHTDMEDFAGSPNTAQPKYWNRFEASCHSCHATASYNPATKAFFPFSVPTGALNPSYNMTDSKGTVQYLGQGYKSLDFMWPIAFQAK